MLRKLLSRNLHVLQLAGFTLANLLGMTIVLVAVQFAIDVRQLFQEGDGLLSPSRLVVAKHVSSLRTLTNRPPVFTEEEMADLRRQPFVRQVDAFQSSQFEVLAAVGIEAVGATFTTEMFFESVPDDCIDVDKSRWHDDPKSDTLPIIMPRNYLNLYNFGYAGARGLPTFSESVVGKIPIRLSLRGRYGEWMRWGRVVGFSKRLNTILVPSAFMECANRELSHAGASPVSRLVVTVDNPADERIAAYLTANNYETETADDDTSRTAGMMRWVIVAVFVIGLCITALAFYVLLLSIFLLLQKHTDKIDTLLLIGYPLRRVARYYHLIALWLNVVVLLVSVGAALLVRRAYVAHFSQWFERYAEPSLVAMLLTAVALFAIVAALNLTAIRRKVRRIWFLHQGN